MPEPRTLNGLLDEQASRAPKAVALRKKQLGIWRELTWAEYAQAVREVALALDGAGVAAGDRVAIFADNDPRWLFADLGIQALGASSLGLYTTLETRPVASLLKESAAAAVVFCGDQEQVDTLLEGVEDGAGPPTIVVFDTKGLHTPEYGDVPIEAFDDFRARGRALEEHRPSRYRELVEARHGDEIATIALTSGTTGALPRGALLSQAGQTATARVVAARLGLRAGDRSFSLLPLAHARARLFDAYAPLAAGSTTNFAESNETVLEDLIEIAPTTLVATPRFLERVKGDVELRMERAARFKRVLYRWSMRTQRRLGRLLVGRFIVDKAGLSKLRHGGIGDSVVSPELVAWFWALGIPIREHYGLVEAGGIVAMQRTVEDAGTSGPPVPGVEARIDERGELLVRGPGLLVGALGDAPGPVGEDGWLRTGDLARIDETGRLVPRGRRAHVLTTASGDTLSSGEIESTLKISPYIASAMVVAEGRPFVTAVVEIREEAVLEWARRHDVSMTTYDSLVGNERVHELIDARVRAANASLPPERQVRAYRLLPRPLDDELTPTGNVKRAVVEERYAALIEEMYADSAPGDRAAVETGGRVA